MDFKVKKITANLNKYQSKNGIKVKIIRVKDKTKFRLSGQTSLANKTYVFKYIFIENLNIFFGAKNQEFLEVYPYRRTLYRYLVA